MNKYTFLGIVLTVLVALFSLHYATNLIGNGTLRAALIFCLILVLVLRKKLNITFSPTSKTKKKIVKTVEIDRFFRAWLCSTRKVARNCHFTQRCQFLMISEHSTSFFDVA